MTGTYQPLYLQVKGLLASQITESLLQSGDAQPPECQLCERFGLSRTTVRGVPREASRQGLVRTVLGRGAFVATPRWLPTSHTSTIACARRFYSVSWRRDRCFKCCAANMV
ncbi:MAG: winged helix-turn-helix domain-containing protein [Anaerolineae bacterium]